MPRLPGWYEEEFTRCLLCGRVFERITWSHLKPSLFTGDPPRWLLSGKLEFLEAMLETELRIHLVGALAPLWGIPRGRLRRALQYGY